MSVRIKFKNDLKYERISCDGNKISVREIKQTIARRKKFGKVTTFDLTVSNAQTGETYTNEDDLISRNTDLEVKRMPPSDGKKMKVWEEVTLEESAGSGSIIPSLNMSGASEEEKLARVMSQSSEMYDKKHWRRNRGRRSLPEGSKLPPDWRCNKCGGHHWVKDCHFADTAMKKTTGIPRSFLTPADESVPGAKITPEGIN